MRVLVAEDDYAAAELLRRTLEKWGHAVHVVSSGSTAWSTYQASPYSLVISDWTIPDVSGGELCRRIRSHGCNQYTYILLMTDEGSREDRLEALRSGADDFLVKPIDPAELFARLEVARRILTMEEQLQSRSDEMVTLHSEVERRNADLAEAMTYLTLANRRFTELFESLPAACYSWDAEGRIHEWNRAAVDMFGYQAEEVVTKFIWDVFGDAKLCKKTICQRTWQDAIRQIFAGESLQSIEMEKSTKNGQRLHVLCNILPVRTPEGQISGAITAQIDITERKLLEHKLADQLRLAKSLNVQLSRQGRELEKVNARLEELATVDGLTGLKNHRHFREILEAGFSFAIRESLPCSVIMLDVDHFKLFNDTYGHPAGDEVLRTVSSILRESVREHDVVARYGGEEFIVLCPGTSGERAYDVASRLRKAIELYEWPLRPITASFGVSTFNVSTTNASELVDQADKALYRSKYDGRNRVTRYENFMDMQLL